MFLAILGAAIYKAFDHNYVDEWEWKHWRVFFF